MAQEPYKAPVYKIQFANGSVLEYGEQTLASIRTKKGSVALDLYGFMEKRIAQRKPGDPDKTANDMAYQKSYGGLAAYLFQAVRCSPNRAIAIIGYQCGNSTIPTDVVQDLVFISADHAPTITRIRSIPLPPEWGVSLSKPRLFWSKKQLFLRRLGGFDILDMEGNKTGEFKPSLMGDLIGLNPKGNLVFFRSAPIVSFVQFNLESRKSVETKVQVLPGRLQYASAFFLTPRKIQLSVSVRTPDKLNSPYSGVNHESRYLVDPNTCKAVLQPGQ
ncbi:MAG: hypothetical protein WCG75_05090 [Armatimonadota bacterium]